MNQILQLIKDNQHIKQPLNLVRNADEASLYIYDVIDAYWGISAISVTNELNKISDASTLNVYINSPGGSVFEARAIMAVLQRFDGKKIAHIDSLCASAATSIALACDEVQMTDGAMFMIHNASALAWGDKTEMRDTANLLEKVELAIINDYVSKTGKDSQEIAALMDAETWFTAQEALDNGFIDSIKSSPTAGKAKNAWNLSAYANAPKFEAENEEPEPPQPVKNEIEEPVKTAGFFMSAANSNKLKLVLAL